MFDRLGRFTTTHPWLICVAWASVAILLSVAAPAWDNRVQDDDIRFMPDRCDSVRGYRLLEQAFPQEVFASRAIFTIERPDQRLRDDDFALVDRLVADLQALQREEPELQIGKVHSYRDPFVGQRLVSGDGQCTLIQAALGTPYLALKTRAAVDRIEARLRERLEEAGDNAPSMLVTGPAGIGRDLVNASANSLDRTTVATILLVMVVLLLVYRSPLLALVPLATIVVSVLVALKLLALMTLLPGVYLVNVSKIFAIVLLYGAGTDYCLFLISRYREELAEGQPFDRSLARGVRKVGGALTASAATVVCGLGLMGLAEFTKIRCAGPAIALSLTVVLLASLTLTPALLRLLGRAVFWPYAPPSEETRRPGRDFWEWVSRQVLARPALIWGVTVVLLLPLALLGTHLKPSHRPTGELSPTNGSIAGLDVLRRHFNAGETGPVTVLLASETDWNDQAGTRLIGHVSSGLAHLDNVAEVRSVTRPLGQPLTLSAALPEAAQGKKHLLSSLMKSLPPDFVRNQANRMAREFYVATLPENTEGPRYIARLDVVLGSDPFDAKSVATLDLIQTYLREELPRMALVATPVRAEVYGTTAGMRDLAQVTESDRLRINLLVLVGVVLILQAVVRKPWLALYLLVSVLFSYWVTLGATALFGNLVLGTSLHEVEWRVPFFLFTILVAVGEDYNILLMKRALQERRRLGSEQGMAKALARTGGTISACGLIMAGTFTTLMLGGLNTLIQIGFALSFGVLLDTFVVRPLLVPAFTLLVWRWLARAEPEVEVEGDILPMIPPQVSQRRAAA